MIRLRKFMNDQSGAVTVDFVVLTAAIVMLGLVGGSTIASGTDGLSNKVVAQLADMPVD